MKFLHYFNLVLLLTTAALFAPILWSGDYSYGMWAALYLGIFQVFLGVVMALFNLKNKMLWIYLAGVLLFFFLTSTVLAWILPPALACYFSVILYVRTFKIS